MPKLILMPPQSDRTSSWVKRLRTELPHYQVVAPQTEDEARRELPDADAAYGWIPPHLLPLANNVRWLQAPAIGPPAGYYYPELIEHPLTVCNPRGIFDDHIGQHIMMFVLALARELPYYMAAQRERRWDQSARSSSYVDLTTATALIVGVGGIGREATRLCHTFGMRVVGVDPRWEHDVPFIEKHGTDDLDTLLPDADFVIVTTPHTPETEGFWNRERFRLMKPSAYFINIGRGMTTRLDDLTWALENGVIAGCGLDVFEVEPLPADHKLWALPNVILTPHIAAHHATNLAERHYAILLENARRFADGSPLRNVVDKAAWY